jgi:hypothetical protein
MIANCIQGRHTTRGGGAVFDMSPAKLLLQQDIKDGMLLHYKASRKLQLSRLQYKPFKAKVFQDHILQEIRLQKYVHYLLELKRAKLLAPPKPKATPKKKTTGKRKK